jgi:hypothetical protein
MSMRRLLAISCATLALGLVNLAATDDLEAATANTQLCGPMCYYWCPHWTQLEDDCAQNGVNCLSAYNCGEAACGSQGEGLQSDCYPI